jgi:predicted DNA-binding protein
VATEKQEKVTFYAAEEKLAKLRQLSERTRIPQAEYFREAIDDLLEKYKSDLEGTAGRRRK